MGSQYFQGIPAKYGSVKKIQLSTFCLPVLQVEHSEVIEVFEKGGTSSICKLIYFVSCRIIICYYFS